MQNNTFFSVVTDPENKTKRNNNFREGPNFHDSWPKISLLSPIPPTSNTHLQVQHLLSFISIPMTPFSSFLFFPFFLKFLIATSSTPEQNPLRNKVTCLTWNCFPLPSACLGWLIVLCFSPCFYLVIFLLIHTWWHKNATQPYFGPHPWHDNRVSIWSLYTYFYTRGNSSQFYELWTASERKTWETPPGTFYAFLTYFLALLKWQDWMVIIRKWESIKTERARKHNEEVWVYFPTAAAAAMWPWRKPATSPST